LTLLVLTTSLISLSLSLSLSPLLLASSSAHTRSLTSSVLFVSIFIFFYILIGVGIQLDYPCGERITRSQQGQHAFYSVGNINIGTVLQFSWTTEILVFSPFLSSLTLFFFPALTLNFCFSLFLLFLLSVIFVHLLFFFSNFFIFLLLILQGGSNVLTRGWLLNNNEFNLFNQGCFIRFLLLLLLSKSLTFPIK